MPRAGILGCDFKKGGGAMPLITVSGLTFKYDANSENIFEDASFQFDTDWKLGFIGRNGRGKTTFLKLLMGEYEYYGTITPGAAFSYFPFPVEHPERNTADVAASLGLDCENWELCREMNLLQLPEDVLCRPFDTLSFGERTKALIAALFLRKNHFLLFDEPTNHLDYIGKNVVAEYLRSKKGFIIVSHDRMFLDGIIDHTLAINRANIEVRHGNFSQWLADKKRRDESEMAQNIKLKREISRLKAAARRTHDWAEKVEATKIGSGSADRGAIGHKAAKMMRRSKSLEARQNAAIEQKSGLLRNIDKQEALGISPLVYHSDVVAELSGVSIAYGGRSVLGGINFAVRRGGRVALRGINGCGKSSLIKLVAGFDVPHSGSVKVGSGVKISYAPQDTSHLRGGMRRFAEDAGIDLTLFLAILHKLGFEKPQFETDLLELSEGQKKKILIAKSLSEPAHLYVWDEPLNYIDIQSRMQIEELIVKHNPTMLFAEHDEAFVRNIATGEVFLG
jgi:lincosamide and streptogramin A transport system ATP-binding/permease protein